MDVVACLCSNTRRAALALTARYDAALAGQGLKVTQFSLLRAVERHGRPNLTELAEATGLDRSTLGRNLRVLEGSGLVTLAPGDDQRDRRIAMTTRGRSRLAAATRDWSRVQESLTRALGADAETFVALARRVVELTTTGATR